MKQLLLSLLLTVLMSMMGITAFAHDFEAKNTAGVTIYYLKTSDTEVAVSFKGDSYNSYSNEYTGNVVIPKSVTYNGVTYNVTSIGGNAFAVCSGLTSITIPNSVTSIGSSSFSSCTGLTSITIPNSVTSIEFRAFWCCTGLTSINVESGNTNYDSRNNCNAIIEIETNTLIQGCNNTIIPNSVTSIGMEAFNGCSGLTSVTIPNSVTSIDWDAFAGCSGLTSVTIPNSVTSMGGNAFAGCSGLTSITISNSVTSMMQGVFRGCTGLTSIEIPNSVTDIDRDAFYGCSGLTSVTIPNSVTSIGARAFHGCSGLESITIPNSVTSIGSYAFYNCSGLESIEVGSGNTKYDSRDNCNAIIVTASNTLIAGCKNTVIPNSVTSIDVYAFYNCSGLESITIPNSVTSIDGFAFFGCSGLQKVIVSDIAAWCGISFCDNTANPLSYAHHLYNNENTEITNLVIPDGVTGIRYAFFGCSGLTSVTIPNSVTSIDGNAFWGCIGLTTVTIPNSVRSIGSGAFYDCTGLTSVTVKIETPLTIDSYTFSSYRANTILCVPCGSKAAYQAADYWKDFKEIVEIGDADGDGAIDVNDVTSIINYILDKPVANFIKAAADVDGDGVIDVNDVQSTINIILKK